MSARVGIQHQRNLSVVIGVGIDPLHEKRIARSQLLVKSRFQQRQRRGIVLRIAEHEHDTFNTVHAGEPTVGDRRNQIVQPRQHVAYQKQ